MENEKIHESSEQPQEKKSGEQLQEKKLSVKIEDMQIELKDTSSKRKTLSR